MALNKSQGNMYPWVTHHWSPIRGCKHYCPYCYTQKFDSKWDKPRMLTFTDLVIPLGKGKIIFVGSKCDMWGSWVPDEWINKVLTQCIKYPQNTYVFQSKNPGRFIDFRLKIPFGSLLGTTFETDKYPSDFNPNVPNPIVRTASMCGLNWPHKFITIEPIMEFDLYPFVEMIQKIHPEFVSIGADSKGHHLPEPSKDKVLDLIDALKEITEVKIKDNLERIIGPQRPQVNKIERNGII